MKKIIEYIFLSVAKVKVYFSSAGLYLSIVNFLLILATFKITYNIQVSAYILVPVGFLLILIVGFIDYKFILKHQNKHFNKQNDLKRQLNRIENKLNKILEK